MYLPKEWLTPSEGRASRFKTLMMCKIHIVGPSFVCICSPPHCGRCTDFSTFGICQTLFCCLVPARRMQGVDQSLGFPVEILPFDLKCMQNTSWSSSARILCIIASMSALGQERGQESHKAFGDPFGRLATPACRCTFSRAKSHRLRRSYPSNTSVTDTFVLVSLTTESCSWSNFQNSQTWTDPNLVNQLIQFFHKVQFWQQRLRPT